ncbi:SDR family NAD(P)-dependent oxidoreductase [Parahaliea aestuarii]|uniref:SDR family oxidoreductase n=1 Tax=Parahaliea aestuarii TaxID=1852021 RepID=A0A5C9A750_9GAMM|nr:SDR family oxidoreductase [Parahaliea aestuarii]TXS95041.1 SDR family oxidoreductase [Parahaliea aestuarii]
MDLKIKGKVALISGATKGIGMKVAETLAAEGCKLGICARSEDAVNNAVKHLAALGAEVYGEVADVTDAEAYGAWIDNCASKLGGIDILIPMVSAGNTPSEEAGWQTSFEADVLGPWRAVQRAVPYLEKSDSASIIFFSTTAAFEAFAGPVPYGAMKAALLNYAGNLAIELAPRGIRVNTVSPGPVFVEGGAWDDIKQNMTEIYDSTVAAIPLGRMGSGEEIASQVALLASPLAGYTCGANIVIDGAFTRRLQF